MIKIKNIKIKYENNHYIEKELLIYKNRYDFYKYYFISLSWYKKIFLLLYMPIVFILMGEIHDFFFYTISENFFNMLVVFGVMVLIQNLLKNDASNYVDRIREIERTLRIFHRQDCALIFLGVCCFVWYRFSSSSFHYFGFSDILSIILHAIILYFIVYCTTFFSIEILIILDISKSDESEDLIEWNKNSFQ